jgi:ferrochelatase
MTDTAVVLIAHGTVETLDELPEFLANIRRGHPAPPELVAEVRRRYEAMGGKSPLGAVTESVARKLEARLGMPVRVAMRLFRPYPKEVLAKLAAEGVRRVVVVPLAQHSAHVYAAAVRDAAKEVPGIEEVLAAENWGREPQLTEAFARAILDALARSPRDAALVLTAHSLPKSIVDAGDPYAEEMKRSAADVVAAVHAKGGAFSEHVVAFQSQGLSGGEWLGPDLRTTLEALAARGRKNVVIAPIGFLADHVEILYDLDIEARGWAEELGIVSTRSASLNDDDGLVGALAAVATRVMGGGR